MVKLLIIGLIILAVVTGAGATIYHLVKDDAQKAACSRAAQYRQDHPGFKGQLADDILCKNG
ncbi:MAG TPA: hypothetical protein VHD60_03365 [Candidatus Saccharimonadales bacterium]|nr:hypothetical protein [Candidatus Saccharimonadales bacterium]